MDGDMIDKEEKQKFQKKKVNKLTLQEAKDMLELLEKRGQQTSEKYFHVKTRIEEIENNS